MTLKTFLVANEDFNPTPAFTQAFANAQAAGSDLIIATQWQYGPYLAGMRSTNPALVILCYANAAYADKLDGPNSGKHPVAQYARNVEADYLRSRGWGNWLMDPSNAGWRSGRGAKAAAVIAASGYDGVWWDMLTAAPLWLGPPSYNYPADAAGNLVTGPAAPKNPATGVAWTRAAWLSAMGALAAATKTYLGSEPVSGNALTSGSGYFASGSPSSVVFSTGVPELMAEAFVRDGDAAMTSWRSEAAWKQDVDMLVHAGANGRRVQAYCKAWGTGTQAEKDRIHLYALATFLLGTNGQSLFSFRYDKNRVTPHAWWATVKANLGTATEAYFKIGNIYRRSFTGGVVVVNPTTTDDAVTGTFETITGAAVTNPTIGAHTGAILFFPDPEAPPSPPPPPDPVEPEPEPAEDTEPPFVEAGEAGAGFSPPQPIGDCLFRHAVNIPEEAQVRVYITADDGFELYWNGARYAAETRAFLWAETKYVDLGLVAPGVHQLAVKGTNIPRENVETNIAAILVGVVEVTNGGKDLGTVYAVSDETWKVNAYPSPIPGLRVGHILRLAIAEAQERGALVGVSTSFTDTLDSAGDPWPEVDRGVPVPDTTVHALSEVLGDIAEYDMGPNDLTLHAWVKPRGTDLSATVALEEFVNLQGLRHEYDPPDMTVGVARYADGRLRERADATASRRIEAYVQIGTAAGDDAADAMIDAQFDTHGAGNLGASARVVPVAGATPYEDFTVGDVVAKPGPDLAPQPRRVWSIAVGEDETGFPIFEVES